MILDRAMAFQKAPPPHPKILNYETRERREIKMTVRAFPFRAFRVFRSFNSLDDLQPLSSWLAEFEWAVMGGSLLGER